MKLSITLPSLFPDLLAEALDAVHHHTTGIDYEILVVSAFPVESRGARWPNVRWIEETERRGNCPAHARAAIGASGDLILPLCDDVKVMPGWADALLRFFTEREKGAFPYACGLNIDGATIGTVFGLYYPYYPVLRREALRRIGGYYDPGYRAHFGDCDLGLRVWEAGGRCEFCIDARIDAREIATRRRNDPDLPQAATRSSARAADMARFVARWAPVFGRGWKTTELRDFNLNVPGRFFADVLEEHSVHRNDPAFRDWLLERYRTIPHVDFLAWD